MKAKIISAVAMVLTVGLIAEPLAAQTDYMSSAVGMANASLYPQDPADGLYREARQQLNRENYRRAAELFQRIREEYRESRYVADSYYWEAFALYRSRDRDDLETALDLLDTQESLFPEAATRDDAEELYVRVQGMLAEQGDEESARQITERAQEGTCPEDEDDVRVMALNALLNMDADRAVPILQRVLERRDECSVELRRKAVWLLSEQDSRAATRTLLDVVRNDPDREVQEQAVFWLSQVDDEEAVIALDSILMQSDDREIQEKAIFALSQHDSRRAAQSLRRYVERQDVPEELQENAIFWLGQSDSRENFDFLRELYDRVDSRALKDKIIYSISEMDYEEGGEWLLSLALDESEPIKLRKQALFWAGQQDHLPTESLRQLYGDIEDVEMREQVIFVLSQRDERAAVDVLMDIARNETDRELQRKAIFWLGQSDDPRVPDFLLEIINRQIPEARAR
jgi:HEAT repeat protein